MSTRYPGGLITKSPVIPTTTSAPGIWTLEQALQYIKAGTWPGILTPDPFFEYVTMLLPGNGTNGGQNNTFLDSSTNNFTITRNGNTTQGTFSPYGSNWSNYFGGVSGNYLAPQSATSSVAFGTGNFTFECWLNADSTSGNNFVLDARSSGTQNNLCLLIQNGSWLWQYAGSNIISTSSGMITVGTWNHVAFVRNSGTLSLYVNGSLITSVSDSTNYAAAAAAGRPGIAGGGFNTTEIFKGYISNLRIVVGTAVYTSAFTPSTTPFTAISGTSLLTCQSNRFRDASTNNFAITVNGNTSVQRFSPFNPTASYDTATIGGSGYFDGSGDYLAVANSSAFAFGTGNFTVEFWVYANSSSTTHGLVASDQSGGYWASVIFSGTLYWQSVNGSTNLLSTSYSNYYNQWTHVAFVRNSGTTKMYLNGVETASAADSNNYTATAGNIDIGRDADNSALLTGYISNLRIVKGTAVYTSAFTPPTAPVTAITNTSLLTNFTNGSIIDNAMMNDLETVGNAQISTSVSKFGGGSMAFDGTGDYLVSSNTPNITLGSGNWTMECWIYSTDTGGVKTITAKGFATNGGFLWWVQSGELRIRLYDTSGGQVNIASAVVINANTWYHVAAVRNANTVTLYVNGTSVASDTFTSALTSASNFEIAAYNGGTGNFQGYIDDLRITKGYARYTSNFTPPTAAFPTL